MATFNTTTVIKRYNRPSVLGNTLLEVFFANNGTYFDPSTVSAVYIIPDTGSTNGSPDLYIDRTTSAYGTSAYGLLNANGLSSVVAYYDLSNSVIPGYPDDVEAYIPGTDSGVSSIYKVSSGHYAVVADGEFFPSFSATGSYFDVWLVNDFLGSGWKLYWNKFTVYNDRIISYTEPFQITSHSRCQNRYIQLGSKENIRIITEHFITNRTLGRDLKDIWRDSVIDNAEIRIRKRNPQTTGLITPIIPAVSGYTSSGINVTSDDTIVYNFDTTDLEKGDYVVQVKYVLLEQTFVSEEFSVVLR